MSSQKRLIEIDLLSDSEEIVPVKLAKKSEELARVESTSSSTVSASVLEQLMIGIECPICLSTQAYSHALPSCGCTFCYVCIADWWNKKNDSCPMCKAEYHINSLVLSKTTNDVARGLLRDSADELSEWESRYENGVNMKKMSNNTVPVASAAVKKSPSRTAARAAARLFAQPVAVLSQANNNTSVARPQPYMIPRPLIPPTNVDLADNSDVLVTVGPAKKNRSVCQVCQNMIIVPSVKVVFDYNSQQQICHITCLSRLPVHPNYTTVNINKIIGLNSISDVDKETIFQDIRHRNQG
jgi:hypothetical protein